jgi:hypothetical protein
MFFMGTICPSRLTSLSSELSSLNWHLIYSILVLPSLKKIILKFISIILIFDRLLSCSYQSASHNQQITCTKECIIVYHVWPHLSIRWKYIDSMLTLKSYLNRKYIELVITCSNTDHNIYVHIFDKDNVFCWNSFIFKCSPHAIISWHFII